MQLGDAAGKIGRVVSFILQVAEDIGLRKICSQHCWTVHVQQKAGFASCQHLDAHAARLQLFAAYPQFLGEFGGAESIGLHTFARVPAGIDAFAVHEHVRRLQPGKRRGAVVHQLALKIGGAARLRTRCAYDHGGSFPFM